MGEPINPYSPPQGESLPVTLDIRRPASSKLVIVISMMLAGAAGWAQYEIVKESGFSGALSVFAEYPLFTIASALLLASPMSMLRRKPGWTGYLLGGFSSLVLAGYFGQRMVYQFVGWWLGIVPLGFLLMGVAFALPWIVLFARFVFGRPSRQFHGIWL